MRSLIGRRTMGSFFRHSRASLIPTTSDSRIRWFRFDWSVATRRTEPKRKEPRRKDAPRGHSKTLDHRKTCSSSNQRKESSLNNKPRSRVADRPDPMCKQEVALIGDYLAERLDSTLLAAFEKHLGQCPDCTAFLNTYKKTIEATKSFLKIQSLKIWPKPLRVPPKTLGSLATFIFWLHLSISNAYLTT